MPTDENSGAFWARAGRRRTIVRMYQICIVVRQAPVQDELNAKKSGDHQYPTREATSRSRREAVLSDLHSRSWRSTALLVVDGLSACMSG